MPRDPLFAQAPLVRLAAALALVSGAFAPGAFAPARSARAAPTPSPGAPRDVGIAQTAVPRAAGGSFTAAVYYPASAPGAGTPLDGTGAPYPVIAFGHGFQQSVATYSSTLAHLAGSGFIVIAPRSFETSFFPDHSRFADDLRDSLTWLTQQNAISSSLFFSGVNTLRFGASGHSMGGGASVIAADRDPRILAVSTLAAANTTPSAVTAATGVTRPVQFIAGSRDAIVVTATTQAIYAAAPAPRQFRLIDGGFHCGFQDYSEFALFCDAGTISRAAQISITQRLMASWFALYLQAEDARWWEAWGEPARRDASASFAAEDRIGLEPRVLTVTARAGATVSVTLSVTNAGTVATSFALGAEPGPAAALSPSRTITLAPGAGATATLTAQGAAPGTVLTVTARSVFDGGTTDWAVVTVTAPAAPYRLFIPSVLRDVVAGF